MREPTPVYLSMNEPIARAFHRAELHQLGNAIFTGFQLSFWSWFKKCALTSRSGVRELTPVSLSINETIARAFHRADLHQLGNAILTGFQLSFWS